MLEKSSQLEILTEDFLYNLNLLKERDFEIDKCEVEIDQMKLCILERYFVFIKKEIQKL